MCSLATDIALFPIFIIKLNELINISNDCIRRFPGRMEGTDDGDSLFYAVAYITRYKLIVTAHSEVQ